MLICIKEWQYECLGPATCSPVHRNGGTHLFGSFNNVENEVIETRTAKVWLGEDGIIRAISLPVPNRSLADTKASWEAIVKVSGGKRRPALADVRQVKSTNRESRLYHIRDEAAGILSAGALLVGPPISKVLGNFFLGLNKPSYPIKLFTSEAEAIEWLKGFIETEEIRDGK